MSNVVRPLLLVGFVTAILVFVVAFAVDIPRARADSPTATPLAQSYTLHDHASHEHLWDHHRQKAIARSETNLAPMARVNCTLGFAGPYPCANMDLLAFVPTNQLSGGGTAADIWGWTDPQTNKEYAIQAHAGGTSFTDISDPEIPVYLGVLPSFTANVLWRELKVYNNYLYVVADGSFAIPHGLQIFDLTKLRDVIAPTVFVETAHYAGFSNAHTITLNEATGYAYINGSNTCGGAPHMLALSNPTAPAFVGCAGSDGYTHDAQCVLYHGPDAQYQNREICFLANEDTVTLVDITNKNAVKQLARKSYSTYAYAHQTWLNQDHSYFLLDDEYDEFDGNVTNTTTYIWSAADLDNPTITSVFTHPTTCIDHNQHTKDSAVYQSNYTCGLRVYDTTLLAQGTMQLLGCFDTHPANDAAAFAGTWSNFPYYASNVVVVSDIEKGLFILQPNLGDPIPATSCMSPQSETPPASPTLTDTATATATPSITPGGPTLTPSLTPTNTPTFTPSPTPTPTFTPGGATLTPTPTATGTLPPPTATDSPNITIQENHDAVRYDGWRGKSDANARGGSYRVSRNPNDTLGFRFVGKTLRWTTYTGPDQGQARVFIDGHDQGVIDLYSASPQYHVVKTFKNLGDGKHRLQIQVLATKNPASSDTNVVVDALSAPGMTVQDTSHMIRYSGWGGRKNNAASGGTYRVARKATSSLRFTFIGTRITWLTAKGPKYGKVDVYIDNVLVADDVDLYDAAPQWDVPMLFSGLASGEHTIQIIPTNQKHSASKGKLIVVDAFRGPILARSSAE